MGVMKLLTPFSGMVSTLYPVTRAKNMLPSTRVISKVTTMIPNRRRARNFFFSSAPARTVLSRFCFLAKREVLSSSCSDANEASSENLSAFFLFEEAFCWLPSSLAMASSGVSDWLSSSSS